MKLTQKEKDSLTATVNAFFRNNKDSVDMWMHAPLQSLDGKTPAEAMQTKEGAEEVKAVLHRLNHAIFI